MLAAVHIRNIDSAIGADETVSRLRDHDGVFLAEHAFALAQGELRDACIQFETLRPGSGLARWADRIQAHKLVLSFRNDLMLYHQDVAVRQRDLLEFQSPKQFINERVAW